MKRLSKLCLPLICLCLLAMSVIGLSSCDDCEHIWVEKEVISADCTNEGRITYQCSECLVPRTETTPALGHSFTSYVDDGNATCTADGTKTAVCDNGCGATSTDVVPKHHTYGAEWYGDENGHYQICTSCMGNGDTVAHTVSEDGLSCTVCSYTFHIHNGVKVLAAASTCTVQGNIEYYTCCDKYFSDVACTNEITAESVVLPLASHAPEYKAARAASCLVDGYIAHYFCDGCDGYYSDEACTAALSAIDVKITAPGHDYSDEWTKTATHHVHECSCGEDEPGTYGEHRSSGPATLTAPEVCLDCGYVISPMLDHTHLADFVAAEAATCTEDGTREYYFCSECSGFFKDEACTQPYPDAERIISALGHSEEHRTAAAATCTENGNIEHWYCSECDKYFSDAECTAEISEETAIIRKTGHNKTVYDAHLPTCDTVGNAKYWYCETCEKYFSNAACTTEITLADTVIPAKHTAVQWIQGKAANCTKDGNITYYNCTDCDKYFSDSACTVEITLADTVLTKLGHKPTYINGKAATCTEKGTKEYWVCANCNKNYTTVDCDTEFDMANLVIDALGHSVDKNNAIETYAPTCKTGGYSVYKCTRADCGYKVQDNFKDVVPCNETQVKTVTATCQTPGEIHYKCTYADCGAERIVYTQKADHTYGSGEVVAPTCTEDGYTKYTCTTTGCGYSYTDTLTAATGHSWSTVTNKAATCTEEGSATTTCSGCNESTTEKLSPLGHDYETATCTESGACRRTDCDAVAPALGHLYVETERFEGDCETNGYIKYTCAHAGCTEPTKTDYPDEYKATGHVAALDATWTETEKAVEGKDCYYYMERTAPCANCTDGVVITNGDEYENHKYTAAITEVATCTVDGTKKYTCSECGDFYTEGYSDPDAHAWDSGVLQSDGVTTLYTCACGATKTTVSAKNNTSTGEVSASTVTGSDDVELKNATFVPDSDIKDSLSETDTVVFGAEALDKNDSSLGLSDEAKDRIGNQPVYDFTMLVNGEKPEDGELGGSMTVKIPYTLSEGEDPENIMVWYIKDDGTLVEVAATYTVIGEQGYAVFETTHFSYYTVTRMTPAERCKLYDHVWADTKTVPATCLTDGYDMTICMRCGKTEITEPTAALGHNFVLDEATYKTVSCLVGGYEKHACSRCQVSYEVVTKAHGHSWLIDSERTTAATCENSGVSTYVCDHCDGEYTELIPTLKHNYRKEIKQPTCTEDGFTKEICRDCGNESVHSRKSALGHDKVDEVIAPTCVDKGYTKHHCRNCDTKFEDTDIVESNGGHDWDREAPDCEHDKRCEHCNKLFEEELDGETHYGNKLGHKFENGKCARCEIKCEHDYEYVKSVAATCEESAHDVEQCKSCFGTRKVNFTGDPIPHTMSDDGVCTICGITTGNHYLSMVETWKNIDGFALKLTDLSLNVEEYVDEQTAWYVVVEAAQLDVAELMIYIDEDGELQGAATGTLSVTQRYYGEQSYVYSANSVIENGNVYIEVFGEIGNQGADEHMYLTVTTDYLIAMLLEEMVGIGAEEAELLVGWADEYILPIIDKYVEDNSAELDALIKDLVDMFFTETSTEDGFVYVFNYDKLHEINNNLANLTVSEFIDNYFGGGSYDELCTEINKILGTEISDVLTLVEGYGIDKASVVAALNALGAMVGNNEDFDIEEALADEDIDGVTIGEYIFGMSKEDYEPRVDGIMDMLDANTLYSLIAEGDADGISEIKDAVADAIDSIRENIYFAYETNVAGAITELTLEITDFTIQPSENDRATVTVNLVITPDGRINVNFDSIITEINEKVSFPDMGSDEAFSNYYVWEPDFEGDTYEYKGVLYEAYAEGIVLEKLRVDYTDPIAVMIESVCGDSYFANVMYESATLEARLVIYELENENSLLMLFVDERTGDTVEVAPSNSGYSLICTLSDGTSFTVDMSEVGSMVQLYRKIVPAAWYAESKYSYISTSSLGILYNAATGEFSLESYSGDLHSYVLDETKSYEPTGCETTGYRHYVCENCGDIQGSYYNKYHSSEWEYRLHEGAQSCEDGLDELQLCRDCGEVLYIHENVAYDHQPFGENVWNAEKGILTYEYTCPCGEHKGSNVQYIVDTDLELEYGRFSNNNGFSYSGFKLIPDESGAYEIFLPDNSDYYYYLYVNLYDADGNIVREIGYIPPSGNGGVSAEKSSDGYAYELTEGETYYMQISGTSGMKLELSMRESEVISLEDYGCICGAYMTVTDEFKRRSVEFSECSCGLEYYTETEMRTDEMCGIYEALVVHFGDEEYVVYTYYTGESRHETYWDSDWERKEAIDESGRAVRIETQTSFEICTACGETVWKEEYKYIYDLRSGNELASEHKRYVWSAERGELVLEYESRNEYVYITYPDGLIERRSSVQFDYWYENGTVRSGQKNTYVYDTQNPCKVIHTYESVDGEVRTETEYLHTRTEKLIPEESNTYTVTDSEGRLLNVTAEAYEVYCEHCYASISKHIDREYLSADGTYRKTEREYYGQYAISEYDYGYILESRDVYEYGIIALKRGGTAEYQLSYAHYYYTDGECDSWSRGDYSYENGNYCEFTVEYTYSWGEGHTSKGSSHLDSRGVYRLSEGSLTCLDGLTRYLVCYECGMEESTGGTWNPGYHPTGSYDVEGVRYDLGEYGNVCGGYAELCICPCGERSNASVYVYDCDMEQNSEYIDHGDNQYGWKYTYGCAVTDPDECGFTYTYEYGWKRMSDTDCREVYYWRYVFGTGDNTLVLEDSYLTGSYRHYKLYEYHDGYEESADGYSKVEVYLGEERCKYCRVITNSTLEKFYYYDLEGDAVRYTELDSYYENGVLSYTEYYDRTLFTGRSGSIWGNTLYRHESYSSDGQTVVSWNQTTYDYTDACFHTPLVTQTDSDGYYNQYRADEHDSYNKYIDRYIVERTCSQAGVGVYHFAYCYCERTEDVEPYDHDFSWDDEKGVYVCWRCELENTTGNNGRVTLEDLSESERYGEDGYFVIGYYFKESFNYTVSMTLVVDGLDEPIYLMGLACEERDGKIYISISDAEAAVEAEGYSLDSEMLRVNIVPLDGSSGDLEYAITLDPSVYANLTVE